MRNQNTVIPFVKRVYTEEQKARRLAYNKAWRAANPERNAVRRKAWEAVNQEHLEAQNKAYREANRERKAATGKAYHAANRKRIAARKKAWRLANPERAAARSKAWIAANRERHAAMVKGWNAAHPERIAAAQKTYNKAHPERVLYMNLGRRIRYKLKNPLAKSTSTMKLVGCDLDWLRAWFEVQFKPGMTWENQGSVWHIDHIRPCATFNLIDPQQQKLCFHWTNLQPLFASENIRKRDKWDGEAA